MSKQDLPVLLGQLDQYGKPMAVLTHVFGMILFCVGLIVLLASWFFDPSVESTGTYGMPDRTVNIQRLQIQIMIFLTGCFFMVSGAVLWAGGMVYRIVRDAANRRIIDAFEE